MNRIINPPQYHIPAFILANYIDYSTHTHKSEVSLITGEINRKGHHQFSWATTCWYKGKPAYKVVAQTKLAVKNPLGNFSHYFCAWCSRTVPDNGFTWRIKPSILRIFRGKTHEVRDVVVALYVQMHKFHSVDFSGHALLRARGRHMWPGCERRREEQIFPSSKVFKVKYSSLHVFLPGKKKLYVKRI